MLVQIFGLPERLLEISYSLPVAEELVSRSLGEEAALALGGDVEDASRANDDVIEVLVWLELHAVEDVPGVRKILQEPAHKIPRAVRASCRTGPFGWWLISPTWKGTVAVAPAQVTLTVPVPGLVPTPIVQAQTPAHLRRPSRPG